jgi:hypothetical protein
VASTVSSATAIGIFERGLRPGFCVFDRQFKFKVKVSIKFVHKRQRCEKIYYTFFNSNISILGFASDLQRKQKPSGVG